MGSSHHKNSEHKTISINVEKNGDHYFPTVEHGSFSSSYFSPTSKKRRAAATRRRRATAARQRHQR